MAGTPRAVRDILGRVYDLQPVRYNDTGHERVYGVRDTMIRDSCISVARDTRTRLMHVCMQSVINDTKLMDV